jgi:hypothetical protein
MALRHQIFTKALQVSPLASTHFFVGVAGSKLGGLPPRCSGKGLGWATKKLPEYFQNYNERFDLFINEKIILASGSI